MTKLHAFVARGPSAGTILKPHRHEDGAFVVSKSRFARDYIRVRDEADLLGWLEKGYKLRMSNPNAGITAPSLVAASSIFRPVIA